MIKLENNIKLPDGRTGLTVTGDVRFGTWSINRKCSVECPVFLGSGFYDVGSIGAFTLINLGSFASDPLSTVFVDASSIGRCCMVARNVQIGLPGHPSDMLSPHIMFRYDAKSDYTEGFRMRGQDPQYEEEMRSRIKACSNKPLPKIGNDVWIGYGATVLNGVTIGDGAIVGACSTVTKDVEPYTIVGGGG